MTVRLPCSRGKLAFLQGKLQGKKHFTISNHIHPYRPAHAAHAVRPLTRLFFFGPSAIMAEWLLPMPAAHCR